MAKIGRNFTLEELLVSEAAARHGIDMTPPPEVLKCLKALVANILDPMRDAIARPITISSGYRPPALNRIIGGANSSQHTLGQAADLNVQGMTPRQVAKWVKSSGLPFDQLIMEFDRWVHVSFGPRNRRQVLTARKNAAGDTEYLPGIV